MKERFQLNIIAGALATLLLSACGDSESNITEKDPIKVEDDHGDHDDEFLIESLGRLAVLSGESNSAAVLDLDDGDLLETFSLTHSNNSLTYSAGYRFAVVSSRANDYVGFIDSGLWRENHGAHLHDFQQAPVMSDYTLAGNSPTHIVKHDGQMVVFNDGNADAGTSASVQVISDVNISNETTELPTLEFSTNMHGVAKVHGDYLFATLRRDDAETTSANSVLPDQVAVYHLHDNEYEQEAVLTENCPDLHGAAQNSEFVLFGCSDGILAVHQHDDEFEAEKVANIDDLGELRIGTIYGHEENDTFIGIAKEHDGSEVTLVSINPEHGEMEALEWQPASDASPVSYAFSYEGEYFLVLDSKGMLNILEPHTHEHDGEVETHWELANSVNVSTEDLSTMPEGLSLSMTVAQNGPYAYVADPIAKHILQVHLEDADVEGDIELSFAPKSLVWLGIAEEAHEHDHDEDEDEDDDHSGHNH